jgi:hypothetical protein
MVKITLEPARNGLVKRTYDDNHGGSSDEWLTSDVYEETESDKLEYITTFFFDLCEDLGLNLGSAYSKEVITIKKEWGQHYVPTEEELNQKIKDIEEHLQLLKEWKTS